MTKVRWFLTTACPVVLGLTCFAQAVNVLHYNPPAPVRAAIGGMVQVQLPFSLQEGYHVNSDKPSDAYLIPLKLTWTPGPLQPGEVVYPKPAKHKVQSEPKPLSVFSGTFELSAKFSVPATAVTGPAAMNGKLHYQACNDKMCLAPKDIPVSVQIDIVK